MRVLLLAALLLLAACGPDHESLAGSYEARHGNEQDVRLELARDGTGSWAVNQGLEVPFTWAVEGEKLVLRTKNGGLVAGELYGDAIVLQLPDVERLTFLPVRR